MRREELEHAIRAATEIIDVDSVIIIGSQSVLGTWEQGQLPEIATMSDEVDVCPLNDDDAGTLATVLDSVAGEWSDFHSTHGFYIQGVGAGTAVLPEGWQSRLVRVTNINTLGRTGLCLEPHDLCASKLIAHRRKDLLFVNALLNGGFVSRRILIQRLEVVEDERARMARQYVMDMP